MACAPHGQPTPRLGHDSTGFGRAACETYNRRRRAAEAVVAHDPDRLAAAEHVLRGLVTDLNAIHDKYDMIDTLRRE
jgi:hypothetical protein